MGFVRPEVKVLLREWRGVLLGLGICALGLWAGFATTGILAILGWIVAALGIVQTVIALQRKRFRNDADGPGIVSVDEGQVAYFGPLTGGVVPLRDLISVDLDPTGKPVHWVLTPAEGAPVHIPVTASGTEALFDAFAQLKDFPTARMLDALESSDRTVRNLWRRASVHRLR